MDEWTFHGGRSDTARRVFPEAPRPWIDLSTGLNPVPYPVREQQDGDWSSLPVPEHLHTLEYVAARAFGMQLPGSPVAIDGAQKRLVQADGLPFSSGLHPDFPIVAVPGTEIGLRLLPVLGLPAPVRYLTPGYRSHAESFHDAHPITRDELTHAADEGGAIILANPNNPDGHIWSAGKLFDLADRLNRKEGVLIVDEAFADTVPDASLLAHPECVSRPNIIILRSFGKFYGLGGMRLGFVNAPQPYRARLRHILGSWPVNAAALNTGIAAYADAEWQNQTRRHLVEAAARLDDLCQLQGLTISGQCPLFRLIEDPRSQQLFRHLATHGILTRPFDYRSDWLRLGLPGNDQAWQRLESALASFNG